MLSSEPVGKNGTSRLSQHRVATNLQFLKQKNEQKRISAEGNKSKHSKTRYACMGRITGPGQVAQLVGASYCTPEGYRFDSWSEHMPRLQA